MILAIFDFDGTITRRDSFLHFIQFAVGKPNYYRGLFQLSPILVAFTLGFIRNDIAKQKVFSHFFNGWDATSFGALAEEYSLTEMDYIVRPNALERIAWHQRQDHKVVVVSASIKSWLDPWCRKYGIELVSTEVEICNEKLTGRFATSNCYGIEKVKRIKKRFNFEHVEYVYAYGDSAGDREVLALADEKYYKYF